MQCVTMVRKNNQTLDNVKPSVSKGEQKEASLWRAEHWESKRKARAPGAIHAFQRKASPRGNKREEERSKSRKVWEMGSICHVDWLFG